MPVRNKKWLKKATHLHCSQASYEVALRKCMYYVNNIDDEWQMDLPDLNQIQSKNDNHWCLRTPSSSDVTARECPGVDFRPPKISETKQCWEKQVTPLQNLPEYMI